MRTDDEALRLHRIEWCARALAECDRPKTQHEIDAAIERAEQDAARIQGRREPEQQPLNLAA
jgi:hypothetical protein